jgi:ABC-2 type transport system permease protein
MRLGYEVVLIEDACRGIALPTSRVFERMWGPAGRGGTLGQPTNAIGLNAIWLAGAAVLFAWQFQQERIRAALLNIGE